MDEKNVVEEILNSYSEIEVERVISEKIILFKLFGIHFVLLAPDSQNLWARSMILLRNDDELNCPHIMLREEEYKDDSFLPAGQYRYVCLYENDNSVAGHESGYFHARCSLKSFSDGYKLSRCKDVAPVQW